MQKKVRKCEKCMPNSKGAIFELSSELKPESYGKPFVADEDVFVFWKCLNCGHKIPFRFKAVKK